MKIENYDKIEEIGGGAKKLVAGAYLCEIKSAVDNPDGSTKLGDTDNKSYIQLEFDIVEGEFKDYFENLSKSFPNGAWKGNCRRYYGGEKGLSYLKSFITAVEKTNPPYRFEPAQDERTLVGKKVVIVFRDDEYIKKDGTVGCIAKAVGFRSLQDLKEGKITIPEKRTLEAKGIARPTEVVSEPTADASSSSLDDLPF